MHILRNANYAQRDKYQTVMSVYNSLCQPEHSPQEWSMFIEG
ncbi:MAG: hypothetical protein Q4C98_06700 [Capnocytophaga sp.]|nr:hypothetical protein [Capnocytophaga sp.]